MIVGLANRAREFLCPAVLADDGRGLLRQFLVRGGPLRGDCEVGEACVGVGVQSGGDGRGWDEGTALPEGGFGLFGTGVFWNWAGMDAKRADKAGSIPSSILADIYVTTQQAAEARWMRAGVL